MSNDSLRIAAAVRDAVAALVEPLEQLCWYTFVVARRPGGAPGPADHFAREREREQTLAAAVPLGQLLDEVRGWWVADRPPDFDPRATSAAEALLRHACATVRALQAVGDTDPVARCRFVELARPPLDFDAVAAAIRCEVAEMARRPPPDADALPRLVGDGPWWPDADDIDTAAWEAALGLLPSGWRELSPADRGRIVGERWAAAGHDAGPTATTEAAAALPPLYASDDAILEALGDGYMTGEELAKRAGFSPRHVKRRIAEALKPAGLVMHRPGRGYFRPDRVKESRDMSP